MKSAKLPVVIAFVLLGAQHSPAQWIRQSLPVDMGMALDVAAAGDSHFVASGYILTSDFFGRAAYTSNGGITWASSWVPESTRALVAVEFTSTDTGFIAAAYNKSTFSLSSNAFKPVDRLKVAEDAIAAADGRIADGTSRRLRRIGYSEGASTGGMILTTTDGGWLWTVKHVFPDSITYLLGGSFPSSRTGIVAAALLPSSGDYALLKTTDGGSSWSALPIPDSITALNDVCFTDTLRGYAAGRQFRNSAFSGVVIRTTDGGATWDRTDFPAVSGILDIEFPSATTGYAVGTKANSFIYQTTDGGTSWTSLSYQPDTVMLDGICFAPGGVAGTAYGLKIRNDSVGSPLPSIPVALTTTDGGSNWAESFADTSLTGFIIVGGIQTDPLKAYLSGGNLFSDGLMLRTDNGGITEVTSGGVADFPGQFLLHQNYPNPFNGSTFLTYSLPEEAYVSLKIFDLLGRGASTLVEEWQGPGSGKWCCGQITCPAASIFAIFQPMVAFKSENFS